MKDCSNEANLLSGAAKGNANRLTAIVSVFVVLALLSIGNQRILGQQLCSSAAVEYDWNFGNNGLVINDNNGNPLRLFGSAAQPDGRLVAAGMTFQNGGWDFAIVRYTTDGTLDTSFSTDGIATVDFDGRIDAATALAIQPDGKIVVVGGTGVLGDTSLENYAIARLETNGTLDRTFGRTLGFGMRTGKQITDFNGLNDQAKAVALQADGRIVVGGRSVVDGAGNHFAIARYNTNGTLDTSFSSDGKTTLSVGQSLDGILDLIVQPDGKIVAAGDSDLNFCAARFNASGTVDTGFGSQGKTSVDIENSSDGATSLALQTDGKVVLGGFSRPGSTFREDSALIRLNSNGTLDKTFNGNGRFFANLDDFNDRITDIVLYNNMIFASVRTETPGTIMLLDFRPNTPCYRITTRFTGGGGTFGNSVSLTGSRIRVAGTQSFPDKGFVMAFDTNVNH